MDSVWELANDNLTEQLLSAITILWQLNLISKTSYLQFIRTSVWFFQTVSSLKKLKQLFVANSCIRGATYYVKKLVMECLRSLKQQYLLRKN